MSSFKKYLHPIKFDPEKTITLSGTDSFIYLEKNENNEKYSIQFLDMQLSFEKKYKICINKKNKMDKNGFKKMIETFLNDIFYYISQKYIIYRMLYYYENISMKIMDSSNNLVKQLLEQKGPEDLLRQVKNRKFKDLENRIDKFKKEDNKIYEEKKYVNNSGNNPYEAAPVPNLK